VTLVVDASVVVSALTGTDRTARWAEARLLAGQLCAPHLMQVEVTDVLRRAVVRGALSADAASLAYADLLDLRIELYPFAPCSVRVWQLRSSVRSYDAWYVALAELLDVPLATLDLRLTRASGPRCRFDAPPLN
jgi:predicted nucleic acid-binding protein